MEKHFFVYIVTNKPWGTLYIGVTSNLEQRIFEHKTGAFEGFTKRYGLKLLIYAEECGDAYRDSVRKASQEMAENMEDQSDPDGQSRLE